VAAEYAWRFVVIVAAVAILGYVITRVSLVAIAVSLALLVAALLSPIAGRLRAWGAPRAVAAAGAFVGGLAVIGGLTFFIVAAVRAGLPEVQAAVSQGVDELLTYLQTGPLDFSLTDIERARDSVATVVQDNQDRLASGAFTAAAVAAEVFAGLALVLFTTFFFLYDGDRIWGWVVRLFPVEAEARVDAAGRRGWHTLVSYTQGTALVALFDGVVTAIGLVALQVPFAVPLGALVFLGAFVPLVGATIAGVVAVLVALATNGLISALLTIALLVGVQQVEGHVLQPFLLGRFVRVHPLAIVLAVAAGTLAAGVIGALVAVPIMAVLNTVATYLVRGEDAVPVAETEGPAEVLTP
jgi:predicted PurR-regulated permease PerM